MLNLLSSLDIIDTKNQFFIKYKELIENNLNNPKEKHKTQSHHIIPRSYYKQENLPLDNSKKNLVNLKYADHILAHWYLYKCANKDYFQYSNLYALFYMLNTLKIPEDEEELKLSLIHYGEVYTQYSILHS